MPSDSTQPGDFGVSREFLRDAHLAFLEAWQVKEQMLSAGFGEKLAYEAAEDELEGAWPATQAH